MYSDHITLLFSLKKPYNERIGVIEGKETASFSYSPSDAHLAHILTPFPSPFKMTTMREFTCDDMFRFNNVNMDKLTETVRVLSSSPLVLDSPS